MFMVRSFQIFNGFIKFKSFAGVFISIRPSLDDYQVQEIYAENYFVTTSRKSQNPPKSINEFLRETIYELRTIG